MYVSHLWYGRAGTVVGHGTLTLDPASPHTKGLECPGRNVVVVSLNHTIQWCVFSIGGSSLKTAPAVEIGIGDSHVVLILSFITILCIVLLAVNPWQWITSLTRVRTVPETEFVRRADNYQSKSLLFGHRLDAEQNCGNFHTLHIKVYYS